MTAFTSRCSTARESASNVARTSVSAADAAARAGLGARRVRAVGAGDAAGVACGAGVVVVVVGCRVVVAGRRGVVALLFAFCAAATAASMSTSAAMVNELLIMMITSFEKSSVV